MALVVADGEAAELGGRQLRQLRRPEIGEVGAIHGMVTGGDADQSEHGIAVDSQEDLLSLKTVRPHRLRSAPLHRHEVRSVVLVTMVVHGQHDAAEGGHHVEGPDADHLRIG